MSPDFLAAVLRQRLEGFAIGLVRRRPLRCGPRRRTLAASPSPADRRLDDIAGDDHRRQARIPAAFPAEIGSPLSIIGKAFAAPIRRGRRCVPPAPG
jgi:hypothetical protein